MMRASCCSSASSTNTTGLLARHASTMVAIEATLDAVEQALARKAPDTRTSLAGAA